MGHELSNEITLDGANDDALSAALNLEAGTSPEFHEGEDNQISDAACENTLMHHILLRQGLIYPPVVILLSLIMCNIGHRCFALMSRGPRKRFSCNQPAWELACFTRINHYDFRPFDLA